MKNVHTLNVAIVGGGPGCKAIMDMMFAEKLSELRMNLVGVASTNTDAVGYRYAREKGIYTTRDYKDLYELDDLDMIIELTGRDDVAKEVARTKPDHVRLIDHVGAHLFWDIFRIEEERIAERRKAEKQLQRSEKRYRELYEGSRDGYAMVDMEGKIIECNSCFREMLGYGEEELFEKTYEDITLAKWHSMEAKILEEQVFRRGYSDVYEKEYTRKDGTIFPIEIRTYLLKDDLGRPAGMWAFVRDVTDRKEAEAALRKSEGFLQSVFDGIQDGISVLDHDLNIIRVNSWIERMYEAEQPHVGKKCYSVYQKRTSPCPWCPSIPTMETGQPHMELFPYPSSGNPTRWVEVSSFPLKDAAGQVQGVIEHVKDVTQRKLAEQERKHLESQLQQSQKLEAIGTLAGGIAHDFNNLLMGIQGNVSLMLLDRDAADPDYERLGRIEKQIRSGARLTSHILAYARKGKYEVRPVDLNRIVQDVCETFGRTRKEITIHQQLGSNLSAIEADSSQIEQVLLNLFVNSGDAMPHGGDLIVKTVNTTHAGMERKLYSPEPGDYVQITVTDTGTGMDGETMARIFEPFFTTKEMGDGTGLGLASAYGIVKSHGGYIDVRSRLGQGATFTIYLPASKKKPRRTPAPDDQVITGGETVLLVDDEDAIREVGEELLQALGYHVLIARDGKEALELYEKHQDRIDIVLLDVVMPKMGGSDAFDNLKKISPDVKILLLSGYSIDGQATEILKRGCDGFIQKPFSMRQLSGKIRAILDRAHNETSQEND